MKKIIPVIVTGLLFFVSSTLLAEESMNASGSLNMYVLNGVHFFNYSNLNNALVAEGFPKVNGTHSGLGVGGFGTVDRLVIGAELSTISSTNSKDTVSTKSDGAQGIFYIGYKIISNNHFELYPITGVGLAGTTVTITQKQNDFNFTNFLATPLNSTRIGLGNAIYHISLAIDYKLKEHNTLFLGLRAGYVLSGSSEWKADNFYFVNAPKDKFENMYLQLILGISIGT